LQSASIEPIVDEGDLLPRDLEVAAHPPQREIVHPAPRLRAPFAPGVDQAVGGGLDLVAVDALDENVADDVHRPVERHRGIRVAGFDAEHAIFEAATVAEVDQVELGVGIVRRLLLARPRRHPIDGILGVEREPVLPAPPVEQHRLAVDEVRHLCLKLPIDRHHARSPFIISLSQWR
jgi:hypothetical protein